MTIETHKCKICGEEKPATEFYASNKTVCKSCIYQKNLSKRKQCSIPGCTNTVDRRCTLPVPLCKHHTNLAWHNGIEYTDIEAISKLEIKRYFCKACGKEVSDGRALYCESCSQIKRHYPELTDKEILEWETNEARRERERIEKDHYQAYLNKYNLRVCSKCKQEKDKSEWSSEKREWCKECERKHSNDYYHLVQKKDPTYKLKRAISQGVRFALRRVGSSKAGTPVWERLPYSLEELKTHLESLFTSEMSWDNYGSYWVIDHIVPQALFSYRSMEDPKFKVCWNLNNLRPLSLDENSKKSATHMGQFWTYDKDRWD